MASTRILQAIAVIQQQIHKIEESGFKKTDYANLEGLKKRSDASIIDWFKRNSDIINKLRKRNETLDQAIAEIEKPQEIKISPAQTQTEKEKKSAPILNTDILGSVTQEEIKQREKFFGIDGPISNPEEYEETFEKSIRYADYPAMVMLQRRGVRLRENFMKVAIQEGRFASALLLLQMNCPVNKDKTFDLFVPKVCEFQYCDALIVALKQKGCEFSVEWFERAYMGDSRLSSLTKQEFELKEESELKEKNQNVFSWACMSGKLDRVQAVYEVYQSKSKKLTPEVRTKIENNALIFAISFNQLKIVEELLKYGFKLPQNCLNYAATLDMVKLLVDNKTDIHTQLLHNWMDNDVVSEELPSIISFLSLRGLSVTEPDKFGERFFHKLFLGVNVDRGIANPRSQLLFQQLKQFMIESGQLDSRNGNGETALYNAVRASSLEDVRYLLDKDKAARPSSLEDKSLDNEDVDFKPNKDGQTPLMFVEDVEIAMLLVEHGFKWDLHDKRGKNCLHYLPSPQLIALALNAGVNLNETYMRKIEKEKKEAITPFHQALRDGRCEAAFFLLKQEDFNPESVSVMEIEKGNKNNSGKEIEYIKILLFFIWKFYINLSPEDSTGLDSKMWVFALDAESPFYEIFWQMLETVKTKTQMVIHQNKTKDEVLDLPESKDNPQSKDLILGMLGLVDFLKGIYQPKNVVENIKQAVACFNEMKMDCGFKNFALVKIAMKIEDFLPNVDLGNIQIQILEGLFKAKLSPQERLDFIDLWLRKFEDSREDVLKQIHLVLDDKFSSDKVKAEAEKLKQRFHDLRGSNPGKLIGLFSDQKDAKSNAPAMKVSKPK